MTGFRLVQPTGGNERKGDGAGCRGWYREWGCRGYEKGCQDMMEEYERIRGGGGRGRIEGALAFELGEALEWLSTSDHHSYQRNYH